MSIHFENELNPAQWEAVRAVDGPVLVIAGAGSGKTRTIVYRLAYLTENGVEPENILLLTFTRKAAQEMIQRAEALYGLGGAGFRKVQGGTFHSFAFSVLRRHAIEHLGGDFTIMDRSDSEGVLKEVKSQLGVGKGDKSFPKIGTVLEYISKSRNKERSLEDLLPREAYHLLPYADDFRKMGDSYASFKRDHGLMDYDDLLFEFEALLRARPDILEFQRNRFRHIMVDEYQDTNLVQARLVKLLAGDGGNVMAVGDDAQSIYAFRGATVDNILQFPTDFPGAKLIKLEQNYRSTQPILTLTNEILRQSPVGYEKNLFSEIETGPAPEVIKPLSDTTQATMVADKIRELRRDYPPHEIAVLFRAGYMSYQLEMILNKRGVRFRKFGGLKATEAAHIKDALSYVRLVVNPSDLPAWNRAVSHIRGIGPKTASRIYTALLGGDRAAVEKARNKYYELARMLDTLDSLREKALAPAALLEQVLEFYKPVFREAYPEDWNRREHGFEELLQIADGYTEIDQFLADLSLENPGEDEDDGRDAVVLSTIHSAKGLEWSAVMILDLVEERFPSRHALNRADDFEEERRLMYVACTRAREYLGLFVPATLTRRGQQVSDTALPSPFVRELPTDLYEEYCENYTGSLSQRAAGFDDDYSYRYAHLERPSPKGPRPAAPPSEPAADDNGSVRADAPLRFCRHKIFGRGKIVKALPPDKYQVNFPGFGLKTILADYLELE